MRSDSYLRRKKAPVPFVSTAGGMDKQKRKEVRPSKLAQVIAVLTCIHNVPDLTILTEDFCGLLQ